MWKASILQTRSRVFSARLLVASTPSPFSRTDSAISPLAADPYISTPCSHTFFYAAQSWHCLYRVVRPVTTMTSGPPRDWTHTKHAQSVATVREDGAQQRLLLLQVIRISKRGAELLCCEVLSSRKVSLTPLHPFFGVCMPPSCGSQHFLFQTEREGDLHHLGALPSSSLCGYINQVTLQEDPGCTWGLPLRWPKRKAPGGGHDWAAVPTIWSGWWSADQHVMATRMRLRAAEMESDWAFALAKHGLLTQGSTGTPQ